MHLIYLKEGRNYAAADLVACVRVQLPVAGEPTDWLDAAFLERLRQAINGEFGKTVVKGRKENGKFVFHYLGLYDYVDEETEKNLTFFFVPKFIDFQEGSDCSYDADIENEDTPEGHADAATWQTRMKAFHDHDRDTVLRAIDRYNKEQARLPDQVEASEKKRESVLELAVRVLRDYLENGAYIAHYRELEHLGEGEVDWVSTVEQCQPIFVDGDPVYADYLSERAQSDENYYITRLQRSLVTYWGRKLEALGLASVLGVNVPPVSEEELDFLGEPDYQVAQIDRELKIQFVTKARETLGQMKELIQRASENRASNYESLSFGMTGVEHLWEDACAEVLGTELEKEIRTCGFPDGPDGVSFSKYMPRIYWTNLFPDSGHEGAEKAFNADKGSQRSKKAGWRLDFIRAWRPDPAGPAEKLAILDAKYYCARWWNGSIAGQPGTPDIAKQMFYQMAFYNLIAPDRIVNAFLLPEDDKNPRYELGGDVKISETVRMESRENGKDGFAPTKAFADINLFAVRIPGIRLLERYADYDIANDWFEKIVGFDGSRTEGNSSTPNSTGPAPVPSKVEPPLKKPVEQTDPKGNDVSDADSKDAGSVSRSEDLKEESCFAKDQPKGDETKGTTDVSSEGESDDTLAAESAVSNANANSNVEKANIEPTDQDGKLTKDFIRDVMSVPSVYCKEDMMKEYIQRFAGERRIKAETDAKGNIYITKGEAKSDDYYPCLVNHMDTVQTAQGNYVDRNERLLVKERERNGKTELYVDGMGIGADDKLGCAIALALIDQLDVVKAVFFVEEEKFPGMLGSKAMDVEWFKDVAFCLSFDSPERNRSAKTCSQVPLYSEDFFKNVLAPVCRRHGITEFREEPYTDVVQVRQKTPIMCYNVGNGGYNPHCSNEYLVVEDAQAAYAFGKDLLESME